MQKIKLVDKMAVWMFVAAVAITLLVVHPYVITILSSILLAYVFYPVYSRINKKLGSKSLSSFLTVILIIFLIAVPIFFILSILSREVLGGYLLLRQWMSSTASNLDLELFGNPYLSDSLGKIASYSLEKISEIFLSLPKAFLHMIISLLMTYYLFKDGRVLAQRLIAAVPLKKKHKDKIVERFSKVTYAVVYGNVLVAVIQGILATIGFFIFGVPSPILWGAISIITALVPFIGPIMIWAPAAAMMIITGYVSGDNTLLFKGIGLAVYGFILISSSDNVLKPKIIGDTANVHPMLVLIGAVSGLTVFGFIGLIIGPVLLSLAATLIELAAEEKDLF